MAAKKPPANPVTEEHLQQFAACVVFWADVLGLHDWRVTVSEKRSNRKVMAEVYKFDLEQRSASIRMGRDFGGAEVTERGISDLALQEDIDSAEHRLINVLERRLSDASPLGPK
jgi:hypothetical protein